MRHTLSEKMMESEKMSPLSLYFVTVIQYESAKLNHLKLKFKSGFFVADWLTMCDNYWN